MTFRIRTCSQVALAVGLAAGVGLPPSSALAQPNPFDDYEEGVPAVDLEEPEEIPADGEEETGEEVEAPTEAVAVDYNVEQFLWSVGLGTSFAYSGTTNEVLAGGEESNRTLFLRLAPRVGFFPIENFEVGLALGLLTQLAARESGDSVAQNNFYFEASAHYHVPVGAAFAIVPGVGLGGYFGSSSRTLQMPDGTELNESTGSSGFLLNGYLGVGYQPSENWRLRSGITVSGLFGSETVESQDATLASSAVNVGLPIELSYLFD